MVKLVTYDTLAKFSSLCHYFIKWLRNENIENDHQMSEIPGEQ